VSESGALRTRLFMFALSSVKAWIERRPFRGRTRMCLRARSWTR